MSNAAGLLAGMSADAIRANETRLHLELEKLANSVGVVQSVWMFAPDGRALVSSLVYPAPTRSYADRDFIKGHLAGDIGVFYGQVYVSDIPVEPFFTVSRRIENNGTFVGILEISVTGVELIQKPVSAEQLAATVRRVLDS